MTRRRYTRWTPEERRLVDTLLDEGVASKDAFHLFPGRNKQFVWNIFAEAKRARAGKCVCGQKLDGDFRYCSSCRAEEREKRKALRAKGICVKCRRRPADASLTYCTECFAENQKYNPVRASEESPTNPSAGHGLVRWLSSGSFGAVIEALPKPVDEWTVVDVFGGSADVTIRARRSPWPRRTPGPGRPRDARTRAAPSSSTWRPPEAEAARPRSRPGPA